MTAAPHSPLTEARRLAAEYGPLKDLAAALPRILADTWNEGWAARNAAVDPSARLRTQLERHATTRRLAELAQRYGVAEAAQPVETPAHEPAGSNA